ncbi:hypothetical protein W02_39360 [Nitrospira sp. KM1]|uniref:hypothetical protein n=1 Tax=Nitrospira sp. KM1 TaxID=1936990 RepID=UPI0013A71F8A|nr:hypothetical protein [Nitrospira sp. KM1]BCA56796.1 hypothetical protein W02_39360 [Nitrospira sp. KM1]
MNIRQDERDDASMSNRRLLELLRERGPQTLDHLCAISELGWSQVLLAVDRLSRTREVVLHLIGPCEYHVSLTGADR